MIVGKSIESGEWVIISPPGDALFHQQKSRFKQLRASPNLGGFSEVLLFSSPDSKAKNKAPVLAVPDPVPGFDEPDNPLPPEPIAEPKASPAPESEGDEAAADSKPKKGKRGRPKGSKSKTEDSKLFR